MAAELSASRWLRLRAQVAGSAQGAAHAVPAGSCGHGKTAASSRRLMLRPLWPDESPLGSPAGQCCLFPKAGLGSREILEHRWQHQHWGSAEPS